MLLFTITIIIVIVRVLTDDGTVPFLLKIFFFNQNLICD